MCNHPKNKPTRHNRMDVMPENYNSKPDNSCIASVATDFFFKILLMSSLKKKDHEWTYLLTWIWRKPDTYDITGRNLKYKKSNVKVSSWITLERKNWSYHVKVDEGVKCSIEKRPRVQCLPNSTNVKKRMKFQWRARKERYFLQLRNEQHLPLQ